MELQTRIWTLDNLEQIDDRELPLIGAPEIVASPQGPAVEFNGTDDGIELDVNPLIVGAAGDGAKAVDGRATLKEGK